MTTTKSYTAKAYSAESATAPLVASTIPRREPTDYDVQIEILYCGICHSDLHYKKNEWSSVLPTHYPCVPGHEIVGRVAKVGPKVTKIQNRRLGGRRLHGGRGYEHLPVLSRGQRAVLSDTDHDLRLGR